MRRLSKLWPPADVSPEGQVPRRFSHAERDYLAALPHEADPTAFARSEFDLLDKSKLRAVMYREQHGLCVYCERRVEEGHPAPRIDHWRPLSLNHDVALHWRNLYLSCPTPETCDSAKGDRPLKWDTGDTDMPWPTDLAYERHVGFTSRGEIYVRNDTALDAVIRRALQLAIDDQFIGTQTREAILNLNHPALVAARAAAIDSERTRMEEDFANRTATRKDREQRANALLAEDLLQQFVSIRVCWLRKTVGKGR